MKILFATGFLEDNLNANNKITCTLARILRDMGHTCVVAGISEYSEAKVVTEENFKKVYLNSRHICDRAFLAMELFVKKRNLPREKRRKLFSLAHPVYALALYYKYNKAWGKSFSLPSYQEQTDKIITQWQPDVVIASYSPAEHAFAAAQANNGRSRLIAYQLDPWGLHSDELLQKNRQENVQKELSLFEMADSVITTPVLLSLYQGDKQYSKYTDKMTALDFPCFERPDYNPDIESVFDFDKENINILFAGTINDDNRNPRFILRALAKAREKAGNIKAYFLGTNSSDMLKKYRSENDWVICHENVSVDKARRTIDKCDVLLNISNIFPNQVPSKIFEYFATGKPVLNVEKIENCPAREYIDRYPLSFTVCEWDKDLNTENLADKLCGFLQESKGKKAGYEKTKELFYSCTPEYSGEVFDKIIRSFIF